MALALDLLSEIEAHRREAKRLEQRVQSLTVHVRARRTLTAPRRRELRTQLSTVESHIRVLARHAAAERQMMRDLKRAARDFRQTIAQLSA